MYNLLYTFSMNSLDSLFSSTAKVRILRALFSSSQAFSLRQLARLCQIPVFSVQKALQQLVAADVVKTAKVGHKLFCSPNPKYFSGRLLRTIFVLERNDGLQKRADQYSARAKSALQFASTAHDFFHNRRKCAK